MTPQLVIEAILKVVDAANRHGGAWHRSNHPLCQHQGLTAFYVTTAWSTAGELPGLTRH
jgi:hypothetical protein